MNKLKFSVFGQMLLMVKSHFTTAVLFMIIFLLMTSMMQGIGGIIFGILGVIGYFLTIYSAAVASQKSDRLPSSPLTPKPLKGFILPLLLIALNLLIVLLYKAAWAYASSGGTLQEPWSLIANIIALLWVAPYQPILGMASGHIELHGYIIIFVLPVVASGLGYLAEYKGFDLSEKLRGIAYEKKEDKTEF